MKNITIMQVMDYAAPYEGNFICSLKDLEIKLNNNNSNMVYLFPDKAKEISWVKEIVKEINNENRRKVYFLKTSVLKNLELIRKIIKTEKVDIVHSHFCLPKTQLAVKLAVNLSRNVKLVQHYHNHYQLPNNYLKNKLFKYIFCGDLNIGCSQSVAQSIIYDKRKVTCVPNAIYFPRLDEYEKIDISKYGIQENSKVILMFGFDFERKGVDIAIEAIKIIAEQYNIILLISISVNKESVRQKIIDRFGEVPKWVKLIDSRNDVASYYRISDIFLSAAREEGFCYALIEALYCNCICISSNIPGPPLHVPGIEVFRNEDILELRDIVKKILDKSNDELNESRDLSRKYILKQYSIDDWSSKVINNYDKLIIN